MLPSYAKASFLAAVGGILVWSSTPVIPDIITGNILNTINYSTDPPILYFTGSTPTAVIKEGTYSFDVIWNTFSNHGRCCRKDGGDRCTIARYPNDDISDVTENPTSLSANFKSGKISASGFEFKLSQGQSRNYKVVFNLACQLYSTVPGHPDQHGTTLINWSKERREAAFRVCADPTNPTTCPQS